MWVPACLALVSCVWDHGMFGWVNLLGQSSLCYDEEDNMARVGQAKASGRWGHVIETVCMPHYAHMIFKNGEG